MNPRTGTEVPFGSVSQYYTSTVRMKRSGVGDCVTTRDSVENTQEHLNRIRILTRS